MDDRQIILTPAAYERLSTGTSIVGHAVPRLNGGTVRLGGVLSPDFLFPRASVSPKIDALSYVRNPALIDIQGDAGSDAFSTNPFFVLARLRDGVTARAAQDVLGATMNNQSGLSVTVQLLTLYMRRGLEPLALGAYFGGALVLLICAGNVGNLLLARGVYRAREFATREAIGATRPDLLRLIMVEFALIAAGAIAVGLLLTHLALVTAAAVIPEEYSALGMPAVTGRVISYACIAGTFVMMVSAIPAWAAWRVAPRAVVAQIGFAEGRAVRALRFGLAAAQSAFAVVLFSGAALMLRSYLNLQLQDTGFARGVQVLSVSYPSEDNGARLQAEIDATIERLRRIQGIAAVGAATGPMVDSLHTNQIMRVGGVAGLAERKFVSGGYFDAVGARIVDGRGLRPDDGSAAAVVNESFARRYWPAGRAVGQQVTLGPHPTNIVGVVHDTFDVALDVPPGPTVFTVLDKPAFAFRVNYAMRFAPRSRPGDVVLAREVAAVNADAVLIDVSTLSSRLAATIKDRSFATLVLTFFSVAGLCICCAGLIGIISFVIARRTRELAVRMALGATPSRIRRLVVREAVAATGVGAVAGLITGRWLSTVLQAQTYGVRAGDWLTTISVAVLMVVVVAIAATIPAARAVRLSPSAALREE